MANSMSQYRQNGVDYIIDDPTTAQVFVETAAYTAGTYVKHQGNMYRFTTDHEAGAWNASEVTQVTLGQEVSDLKSALNYSYVTRRDDVRYFEGKYKSCNDIDCNSIYFISSSAGVFNLTDFAFNNPGWIVTTISGNTSFRYQIAIPWNYGYNNHIRYRFMRDGTNWSPWQENTVSSDFDFLTLANQAYVHIPVSVGGVTFEYDIETKAHHCYGSSTSIQYKSWWENKTKLPDGVSPGDALLISYDGVNTMFRVYSINSSGNYKEITPAGNNGKCIVPVDAVGLAFRLWVASGVTFDEYVHPIVIPLTGITKVMAQNVMVTQLVPSEIGITSCDEVTQSCVLFVRSSSGIPELEGFPFNSAGWLMTMYQNGHMVQIAYPFYSNSGYNVKFRTKSHGAWYVWRDFTAEMDTKNFMKYASTYSYESCDDVKDKLSILFVGSSGGVLQIPDAPYIGFLQTIYTQSNIAFQIMYPWFTTNKIKYRLLNNDGWSAWMEIGSGYTTNVTQNISRDTYNNTININTSPQITTDSNGWLQPVDTNTADETGKTDMSGAILSMLKSTGYCHLAPGIFYVSGNIDMPADSMIEGCGKQTIIRLLQSVESGYIVRMHTRSTVKNVCFSGGYSAGSISDGNIGGRKGINYIANRNGKDSGVTPRTCTLCQIEGCWFENLDSGFYGYNAGGGLQEGVEASNCYFTRCKAGINIDYWTEYSKFVNCVTYQCYYGCINNGGNNVFMNCTFHAVIGFLIDNSAEDKDNCAHGSVIGCTFNHIDNMNNPSQLGKGLAIKVLGALPGFLFANCQIWYGRIHVEDSKGIQITGCEIGGIGGAEYPLFEFSGTYPVFVDNCLFQGKPSNSITSPVKFSNCWTYDGVEVAS